MKLIKMVIGLEALSGMNNDVIDVLLGEHEHNRVVFFEIKSQDGTAIVDSDFNEISFNSSLLNEYICIPDGRWDEEWECEITSRIYHKDILEYEIKESKLFLSFNGNILVVRENELPFWVRPNGEYLNTASVWDVENVFTEIKIPVTWDSLELLQKINRTSAESWKHIATVNTGGDYSRYKWATCNNGGDYGYNYRAELFLSNRGRIAVLDLSSTTSEFCYDEYGGGFDQNAESVRIFDAEDFVFTSVNMDEEVLIKEVATIYNRIEDIKLEYYYSDEDGEETRYLLSKMDILRSIVSNDNYNKEYIKTFLRFKKVSRRVRR